MFNQPQSNPIPGQKVPKNPFSPARLILYAVLAIFVLIAIFSSVVIVPAGSAGVTTSFGAVQPDHRNPGFGFKVPFRDKVINVETRVKKVQTDQNAASKDQQKVTTSVSVNYSVLPASAPNLYNSVGLDYEVRIIDPQISEGLKSVTARYNADELIQNRDTVSSEVKDALVKKLTPYGIKVEDISITDFVFSNEYAAAIEAKQVADQNVRKAKLDLERIKIEKDQAITQAQAQAEALRLQKQEVTPELVELRRIEANLEAIKKWNGVLPSVTGGSTPMVDISSLTTPPQQ